jgi:hypothetical protein
MIVFVKICSIIKYAKRIILDNSFSEKGIAEHEVAVSIEEHRDVSLHV